MKPVAWLMFAFWNGVLQQMRNAEVHPAAPEQVIPSAPPAPEDIVRTAFVDPNDPTKVYVAQPSAEERIQPQQGYPTLTQRAGAALRAAAVVL